jgi:glycosyltransferase involved in cell wall biosynthesis
VFVGARTDWNAIGEARLASLRGAVVHRCGHFWGLRRGDVAFDFLRHPARRICTSRAIAAEFRRLGAPGEIHVVPNGVDLSALPPRVAAGDRTVDVVIVGMKRPDLARAVHRRLARFGRRLDLMDQFVARREFLARVARANVGVFLPAEGEGFHIPPLEAMALGTLVVCPDVRGNADYCRDGDTALMPAMEAEALADAARRALALGRAERDAFVERGRAEALAHDIATERAGVLAVVHAAAADRR